MKSIELINEIMDTQLKRIHERTKEKDLTKDDAQVLYTLSQIVSLHSKFSSLGKEEEEEMKIDLTQEQLTEFLKKK